MILEVPLRYRKKRGFGAFKYAFDGLSDRKHVTALERPVDVPEGIVRDLTL